MRREVRNKKVLHAIAFAIAMMIAVSVKPMTAHASSASPAQQAAAQQAGGQQASEAHEGENDQGHAGDASQEEEPLVGIEATVENVEKLLNDINREETGADASTLTVYYNTPASSPLKVDAQYAHDNVMLTKTCLDDLKTGLETNSAAVEAAEKISDELKVTELVKENPDVVDQNDPKLFEFVNEDGSQTQVECVNNFGDCASTFDAQMKLAEQELQNAKNAQSAASDKEAKDYAVESRNYLSNANSAITTANGLIIAAEAAITTAKEDLNTANNAFAKGKSKAGLTNMQNNLLYAKGYAHDAAESASTVYSAMNESSNPVDPNTKTFAKKAKTKTANLSIELNRLTVTSAPGAAALESINGQITAAERKVSLAKRCLTIMQNRYNTLKEKLRSTNLLPQDLHEDDANNTPSDDPSGQRTDDIVTPSGDNGGKNTNDIVTPSGDNGGKNTNDIVTPSGDTGGKNTNDIVTPSGDTGGKNTNDIVIPSGDTSKQSTDDIVIPSGDTGGKSTNDIVTPSGDTSKQSTNDIVTPSGDSSKQRTDNVVTPSGNPAGQRADNAGTTSGTTAGKAGNNTAGTTAAAAVNGQGTGTAAGVTANNTTDTAGVTMKVADAANATGAAENTANAALSGGTDSAAPVQNASEAPGANKTNDQAPDPANDQTSDTAENGGKEAVVTVADADETPAAGQDASRISNETISSANPAAANRTNWALIGGLGAAGCAAVGGAGYATTKAVRKARKKKPGADK